MSDAVAEALSRHAGDLHLGTLKELSLAGAVALNKHQGILYLEATGDLPLEVGLNLMENPRWRPEPTFCRF